MDYPDALAAEAATATGRQLYGFPTVHTAKQFQALTLGELRHVTNYGPQRIGTTVIVVPNSAQSRDELDAAALRLGGQLPRRTPTQEAP